MLMKAGLLFYGQLVQPVSKGSEVDLEKLRGSVFVAPGEFKGFFDVGFFDFFKDGVKRDAVFNIVQIISPVFDAFNPAAFVDLFVKRNGQAFGKDDIGVGECNAAFDEILKLPDIARKIVFDQ